MNEITAAIKKKAEEKYQFGDDFYEQVKRHIKDDKLCDWDESMTDNEMEYLEQLLLTFKPDLPFDKREAYTCGGEDAIGFMLKFVEWTQKNYWEINDDGLWYKWMLRTPETDKLNLTTEQLLLKYMEETKL